MDDKIDFSKKNLDALIDYNFHLLVDAVANGEFSIPDIDFLSGLIDEYSNCPKNEYSLIIDKIHLYIDRFETLLHRRDELLAQNQEQIEITMKFLPIILNLQENLTEENASEISTQLKALEAKFAKIQQKSDQIEQNLKQNQKEISRLNQEYNSEFSFKMLELFCFKHEIDIHEFNFEEYSSWLVPFLSDYQLKTLNNEITTYLGFSVGGIVN